MSNPSWRKYRILLYTLSKEILMRHRFFKRAAMVGWVILGVGCGVGGTPGGPTAKFIEM